MEPEQSFSVRDMKNAYTNSVALAAGHKLSVSDVTEGGHINPPVRHSEHKDLHRKHSADALNHSNLPKALKHNTRLL